MFPLTSKKIQPLAIFLIAVLISGILSQATTASVVEVEIGQLLGFIEHSGCAVYRNGSWYSASEARAHLEKKYRYFRDKGLMNTTEDFIARVATASSVSGEPYQVKCDELEPISSADWLTKELQRLQKSSAATRP
jgi:hypothetical protein